MASHNSEAKQLLGVMVMWLVVGIINSVLLVTLLFETSASDSWAVRVGLTVMVALLAFGVAAFFARRRRQLREASSDGR